MEAESTLGKSYIQPELIYSFFIFVLVRVQKDGLTNGGDILYTRAHLPFMLVKAYKKLNMAKFGFQVLPCCHDFVLVCPLQHVKL